ncbi:MAG: DUF1080 domain-containing protein [Planctomycetales bacterium]|nr:DUF1080 domain-containing protein [Planctomycetales bacterium]
MKMTAIRTLCLLFLVAGSALADDSNNEWISMFNGRDLDGWKVNENKDSVKVDDGMLIIDGPRAHAFFAGSTGNADFKDFHFQAQVKTTQGSNSGIYFHTEYQDSGWPSKGYECQVNNTHGDPKKTGGLYGIQDNFEAPAKDGEWFNYDIIVKGKHIVVQINGKTISDYTEPEDAERNGEFKNRLVSSGTFAIQAHDPKSVVYFRNIRVKKL